MLSNILEALHQSTVEAAGDIRRLGGSRKIRNHLGTEELLRFRSMFHLEKILDPRFFQSPEVKIGRPRPLKDFSPENGEYSHQPKFDLGILTKKTWDPALISELKFTGPKQLKKHITTDFSRLIDIYEYRKYRKEHLPQYFGLIFFIEFIKKYRSDYSKLKNQCLAECYIPKIWTKYRSKIKERYFEIVIIEDESTESKSFLKLH